MSKDNEVATALHASPGINNLTVRCRINRVPAVYRDIDTPSITTTKAAQ
jgi:hypothetical protein